ncbi:hypothetical protein [Heterosigma akashiwo virus 01]|uniref:Uncharacterized protein n=1 Tax=Heterosigma akashiwo virus 01 TaxID=97195 RepID=A0A1C9C4Y1_HAV01|nr:hypothetical protein D1R72_gp018 [Heterosigma akashiwo virus 01]AOM63349.1 hypothetical protein [Heterosigma akashiwo virus 01]
MNEPNMDDHLLFEKLDKLLKQEEKAEIKEEKKKKKKKYSKKRSENELKGEINYHFLVDKLRTVFNNYNNKDVDYNTHVAKEIVQILMNEENNEKIKYMFHKIYANVKSNPNKNYVLSSLLINKIWTPKQFVFLSHDQLDPILAQKKRKLQMKWLEKIPDQNYIDIGTVPVHVYDEYKNFNEPYERINTQREITKKPKSFEHLIEEEEFDQYSQEYKLFNKLNAMDENSIRRCILENITEPEMFLGHFKSQDKRIYKLFKNTCNIQDDKHVDDILLYIDMLYNRRTHVLPFQKRKEYIHNVSKLISGIQAKGTVKMDIEDTIVFGDPEISPNTEGNQIYSINIDLKDRIKLPPKTKKVWIRTVDKGENNQKIVIYYTDFIQYLQSLKNAMENNKNKLLEVSDNNKTHLVQILERKISMIECFLKTRLKYPPPIIRKIKPFKTQRISMILPIDITFDEVKENEFNIREIIDKDEKQKTDVEKNRLIFMEKTLIKKKNIRYEEVKESVNDLLFQCFGNSGFINFVFRPGKKGFKLHVVYKHPRVKFPAPIFPHYIPSNEHGNYIPVYDETTDPILLDGKRDIHYALLPPNEQSEHEMTEYYIELVYGNKIIREGVSSKQLGVTDVSLFSSGVSYNEEHLRIFNTEIAYLKKSYFKFIKRFIEKIVKNDDSLYTRAVAYISEQLYRIHQHGYHIYKQDGTVPTPVKFNYVLQRRPTEKREPIRDRKGKRIRIAGGYRFVKVIITDEAKQLMKNFRKWFPEYKRLDHRITGTFVDDLSIDDVIPSGKYKTVGNFSYEVINIDDVIDAIHNTNVYEDTLTKKEKYNIEADRRQREMNERRLKQKTGFSLYSLFEIDKLKITSIDDLPNPYFD